MQQVHGGQQDKPQFLRRDKAAEYLRNTWGLPCSRQTLAKRAVLGGGPVYRMAGRFPLYRTADLDAWAESRIGAPQLSTSEAVALSLPDIAR
jgi:hypothetical protein